MPERNQPIIVHGIEFAEAYVAVTFTDPAIVVKGVADTINRAIPIELFPDEIAEIIDSVRHLVDDAAVVRINPPERLTRG